MSSIGGFGSWAHLAGRFFGALSPAGPSPADQAWALGLLAEGEQALWWRMSGPDRRHAVEVAKLVAESLGPEPPPRKVLAAALLHDVGKVEPSLGTFSRVAVTLAAIAFGRTRLLAWSAAAPAEGGGSWRKRTGQYLSHDELGAQLLREAGSDDFTVTWAREHHLPQERWSLDARVASALKAADGD